MSWMDFVTTENISTTADESFAQNTTNSPPVWTTGAGVATVVTFALAVALMNGGLLLIFCIRKNTRKHLSLVLASNLINITIGAILDLIFRLPMIIYKESHITRVSPILFLIMKQVPEFMMMCILLCLPLVMAERFIKLRMSGLNSSRKSRNIFAVLLSVAYLISFLVNVYPGSVLFEDAVAVKPCTWMCRMGRASFSVTYLVLTILAVLLAVIFSVLTIYTLKLRLRHVTSKTRQLLLRQGVRSAIAITTLLSIATLPFAITLQLQYYCQGNLFENKMFCERTVPDFYKGSNFLQKISFTSLPLVLIAINPSMRRHIWLAINRPKSSVGISTLTSTTTDTTSHAKDSDAERDQQDDGGTYITIPVECKAHSSRLIRRGTSQQIVREQLLDVVDILSVISERSETYSEGGSQSVETESVRSASSVFRTLSNHGIRHPKTKFLQKMFTTSDDSSNIVSPNE